MKLTIIPICEQTREMLAELNNGVLPELEDNTTFFIYRGKDEVPQIMGGEELFKAYEHIEGNAKMFRVLYFEDYSQ